MFILSSLSVTWSLVVLVVTLLFIYGVWPHGFFKKLGIPGPRPWPFFGTFLHYRKGFYKFDTECYKKYGKIWGIYDGRLPILMVLDIEMIKSIMVKDCYSVFTNRREVNLDLIGPFADGISVVKDEKWKRIRSSVSPFFTSGRLKEIFPIADTYGDRFIENLKKKNLEDAVKIKDAMGPYSLDVVTSASFSVEIDSVNNPNDPFVTHIKKIFSFNIFSPLFLIRILFPFLGSLLGKMGLTMFSKSSMNFFYSSLKKIKEQHSTSNNKRVDFLHLMLQSQISDEQAQNVSNDQQVKGLTDHEILSQSFIFILGGYETTSTTLTFLLYNLATNPDCLSKLVEEIDEEEVCFLFTGLTDHEILSQSFIFILGGYETTSTTLTFLLYNLATNPDCLSKLVEEIDEAFPHNAPVTYDALIKLEYLEMVINESMRLFPTLARLERVCKKTIELNGITIPKDTLVAIPTYVLYRDPQLWESPEEFRPERFSAENDINPYTFMPFGLGPRNCVGMRFALMIMKVVVVKLLQNFSVETCKETQIPIQLNAFFQPTVPVTLKFTPRSRKEE